MDFGLEFDKNSPPDHLEHPILFQNFFFGTPVLGLGLGVDFTFAWENNNNNDNDNDNNDNSKHPHLNFLTGTVLEVAIRDKGQSRRDKT